MGAKQAQRAQRCIHRAAYRHPLIEAGEATTRTESRDAVDPAVNKKAVIVAMTREQQDEFYARFQDFARRIQPRTLEDSEPR